MKLIMEKQYLSKLSRENARVKECAKLSISLATARIDEDHKKHWQEILSDREKWKAEYGVDDRKKIPVAD